MEPLALVEVLDRRGAVAQRIRIERLPAVIGRAATCDVVLDDRYVDAQHARLSLDEGGALVLDDLGSLNGLRAQDAKGRTERLIVAGSVAVRLGETALRVAVPGQPVPPAVPLPRSGRLAVLLEGTRAPLTVAAVGTFLSLLTAWLQDAGSASIAAPLGRALGVAAGVALWAGVWALAGRINIHRPAFLAHFALTWLFVIATGVLGLVGAFGDFLFPDGSVLTLLEGVAGTALLLALLYQQLGLATMLSARRRAVRSVVVVAALFVLALLIGKAAETDEEYVRVAASLEPVPAALVPADTPAQFLESVSGLQREVDRLAEEE